MKKPLLALCLLLSAILLFAGGGEPSSFDLNWNFDDLPDPVEQGWLLKGFDKESVRDGVLHLEIQGDGKNSCLRMESHMGKALIRSEDYTALEIRMRAEAEAQAGCAPVLRVVWRWAAGGGDFQAELPLILNQGSGFHTYRIDLAKTKGWGDLRKSRAAISIYPAVSTGLRSAKVDLDWLRFIPSGAALLKERTNLAEERIGAASDLAAALGRRGFDVSEEKAATVSAFDALRRIESAARTEPEKALAQFNALNEDFKKLHSRLDRKRRVAECAESAEALRKALDFRRSRKEALKPETVKSLDSLEGLLKKRDADPDELERLLAGVRAAFASDGGWMPGVGDASFGRFGWVSKECGLLAHDAGRERLTRPYFECANGASPTFKIAPDGAKHVSSAPVGITWVSSEWLHEYSGPAGAPIKWKTVNSLLAPGSLFETDAKAVRISLNSGKELSPAAIAVPTAKGVKLVRSQKELNAAKSSANWLLLLPEDESPSTPWLLTLEHRPDSIEWLKDSLRVKRSSGVGWIGVACPWGVRPLPPDFSKGWKELPPEIAAHVEEVAAIMNAYPLKCDEFFKIAGRRANVAQRVWHLRLANAWGTPGKDVAPIPPVLAFAISNGYPAEASKASDRGIPTKYGPYLAENGEISEYSLEIPDLRNPTPLKTDAFPEWAERANAFAKSFYPLRAECAIYRNMPLSGMSAAFASWSLLDRHAQDMLLADSRLAIKRFFEVLGGLGRCDAPYGWSVERTEPFTGKSYLAYGWTSERFGEKLIGDISNFAGMQMVALYDYCKYSGDWKLARDAWPLIQRVFGVCPRRSDWAGMGQDCMEYGFMHTIDMGPDSWGAPCYMAKLAKGVGDRFTEDLALYMAAKQAVPLVSAFDKRRWDMAFTNRWDPKRQLPETGYTESGSINSVAWERADLACNFLTGVIYKPECFRLYAAWRPEAAKAFEYGLLEKFYPQWSDPKYKPKGAKGEGGNNPGVIASHLALRAALGESNDALAEILRKGTLENSGEKLHHFVNCGSLTWLYSAAAALLIGRDAPCEFASWGPARLLEGSYDAKTSRVEARFVAPGPFTLEAICETRPESVQLDGKKLDPSKWRFDKSGESLLVELDGSGERSLSILFPSWRAPERTAIPRIDFDIASTPEMRLCLGERERLAKERSAKSDFQCLNGVPLELSPFFNMSLEASGPSPWFGLKSEGEAKVDGSGLSKMPRGVRTLRGVPFKIGDSAIGLFGGEMKKLPKSVGPIKVGRAFKRLYFLHLAGWDPADGETVMRYVVKFSDGSVERVEIRSGQGIGDWWSPRELPQAKLACEVKSHPPLEGHGVGVYAFAWENSNYESIAVLNAATEQRPLKRIESISVESCGRDGALAVLAITGDGDAP